LWLKVKERVEPVQWLTADEGYISSGVYDVLWDATHAPTVVAAREAAQQLTQNKSEIPLAVGATAMDALVTYVSAHKDCGTGGMVQLEKDLWNIRTLLLAQEDGADSRLEAKDILFNLGFERSDGGIAWHRSGAGAGGGGDGPLPSAAQIPNLALLDQAQAGLYIANRTAQALQCELFALWWKFFSGAFGAPTDPKKTARVTPVMFCGVYGQDPCVLWIQMRV
jgi:hypothetical protein